MPKRIIIESLDVLKAKQQLEESTYLCYDKNCLEKSINDKPPIKKWVKVGRDKASGLWYYENSNGVRSQAIFPNRKKAWIKGCEYIDMIYPKKKRPQTRNRKQVG